MCAFVFTQSMAIGVKSCISTDFLHEPSKCEKSQGYNHLRSGSLLIEPVWNRNFYFCQRCGLGKCTFNRTSLESKPLQGQSTLTTPNRSFNRTSLESKRGSCVGSCCSCLCLLIEPVWNRNADLDTRQAFSLSLLIEPVWKRNIAL